MLTTNAGPGARAKVYTFVNKSLAKEGYGVWLFARDVLKEVLFGLFKMRREIWPNASFTLSHGNGLAAT